MIFHIFIDDVKILNLRPFKIDLIELKYSKHGNNRLLQ